MSGEGTAAFFGQTRSHRTIAGLVAERGRTLGAPGASRESRPVPMLSDEWSARVVRIAAALIAIAALIALAKPRSALSARPLWETRCLVLNLCIGLIAIGLGFAPWFARYWQPAGWLLGVSVVANATAAGVGDGNMELLCVALLLMILGPGNVLPLSAGWQASFSAVCLGAWGVGAGVGPHGIADSAWPWIAILAAAGLAQFTATLRERQAAGQAESQRRVRECETELRKMFETSPDMIAINRLADGEFIDLNEEFDRSGYARAQLLGRSDEEVGLWADPEERRRFYELARARGEVRNLEASFRTRDGQIVPMLLSAVVVELGGEPCLLSVARTIMRLKQTELELEQARGQALAASRIKSEFLHNISHEIRTPLHAILGMTELMLETELTDEQQGYLTRIAANGAALRELIDSILDFSRAESGRLELEHTEFDLEAVLDRVLDTMAARAHEKGLELAARIAPDVPAAVGGDPERLRQVLLNLIGNAVKFTERGEVVLNVSAEPGESDHAVLKFSVADTGIGIARDKLESVFASFAQADSSITRRYGGAGLGLAIAKNLVTLMGGRIWVESEPGEGSTFHFTARLKRQSAATVGARSMPANAGIAGKRVLVVDGAQVNRSIMREMLERLGAQVSEADSVEAALMALERARDLRDPYRVTMLDWQMAAPGGVELARRIRSSGASDELVGMLRSHGLDGQLKEMRSAGIARYLVKPIRRADLLHTLGAATGGHKNGRAAHAPSAATPPIASGKALKILLADDSDDNRNLVAAFLKNTSYQIDPVVDGAQAVERFTSGVYDLVLMDVQMPVMDGHTATRQIRAWERERGRAPTPIVALTAAALPESVAKSIEAGCNEHVTKPVKKATLLSVIDRLTAGQDRAAGARMLEHIGAPVPQH
ncbi:MAG TPA: response regulator [Candidatus Binataceae bacterium]|nr:response regulator [Candidatus Binataceae bacterium]